MTRESNISQWIKAGLTLITAFLVCCGLFGSFVVAWAQDPHSDQSAVRVGWIGAMSGTVAKYGAHEAAILAEEDINSAGGINGREFDLRFQDGKCNSREALTAIEQLVNIDKIKFIVGGHCSTESLPIAPFAERSRILMMAAITSSPKLTGAGDYVFRVTAPNIEGAKLLLEHAKAAGFKKIGIIFEETEYAQGLADYFKEEASRQGIAVAPFDGYAPGSADMRSLVTRLKSAAPDALYLSPQSPDGTVAVLRSMNEQHVEIPVLGNEIAGNTVKAAVDSPTLFEGMVFAEPDFDNASPEFLAFEKRYRERFNVPALPYGFYTCEAYDAVRVIADMIAKCGEKPDAVKKCLYELKDYRGLSGPIAFDRNGDGIRRYVKKRISGGTIKPF